LRFAESVEHFNKQFTDCEADFCKQFPRGARQDTIQRDHL
jgi:hypothetical protein